MKIFLSYASQDGEAARGIYLALRDQGHEVFFDRASLPAGEEYHNRIRVAVEKSHLFIFLISPNAIDGGSYTLTELAVGEKSGCQLLPVMLRETEIAALPASIQAITILRSDGNLAASVAAEVHRIARERRRRLLKKFAAALVIVAAVSVSIFYGTSVWKKKHYVGKDGAPAVLIPAGSFIMGDDENSPRREIFVDSFYMDQYEVTVGRYAAFLKATGNVSLPEQWETVDPEKQRDLPVVGVTWQDAASYCRWAGKRLPTEAEWERAARGNDERKYPWGDNTPSPEYGRFAVSYNNPVYQGGVAPVGTHAKGASPFGVNDLSGNVWEWVSDWYAESFRREDARNPLGPDNGTSKVLRGGGWQDPADRITATKRMYADPRQRLDDIGFRCAADAK